MTVSSRTPEGSPNRCPVCGADIHIESSLPCGDAPCPNCGHLLWFVQTASVLHVCESCSVSDKVRNAIHGLCGRLVGSHAGEPESLDIVELVMEFEDEFRFSIPDEVYGRIRNVDDLIEYLLRVKPDQEASDDHPRSP